MRIPIPTTAHKPAAWEPEIRPEEKGLFFFSGWSLSCFLSIQSLRAYPSPETRQNNIDPKTGHEKFIADEPAGKKQRGK